MGVLNTLISWGQSAWNAITGAAGDVTGALTKIWSFISSLHGLISWLFGNPLLALARALAGHLPIVQLGIIAIRDVLARLGAWIWYHYVRPVKRQLLNIIYLLDVWVHQQLAALTRLVWALYFAGEAYTRLLVGTERKQRIAADAAEHRAMLAQIKALHQAIEKEASSGYNTGSQGRAGNITSLLDDLLTRTPAIRGLERELVSIVLDLAAVDDPLIRLGVGKLLTEIINKAGVDKATGDLVSLLLGTYAGQPVAHDLHGAMLDLARRVTALETQWSDFMKKGGPEVEQAGQGWKDLTSLVTDAAILGFVGLAVNDPSAWATGVNDTIAGPADTALTGIVDLIQRA